VTGSSAVSGTPTHGGRPEDVEHAVDGIATADAAAVVAGLRGPLRWDPAALLRLVRVPALVLAATDAPPGSFSTDGGPRCAGPTAWPSRRCCPATASSSSMGAIACIATGRTSGYRP
jgi:hypothetical protein